MKSLLYIAFLISSTITFANEVSVFGAGNLNSDKPYGLTTTEKHILKNKKELGSIDTKVKSVKSKISSIHERIDGLESIYEGDSQKLNSANNKLNEMVLTLETTNNQVDTNRQDIQSIKNVANQLLTMQEEISAENKKNIDTIKLAIENLSKLVNEINVNYVSSKELQSNMKQFVTKSEFKNKATTSKSKKTKSSIKNFTSRSKKDLMAEARQLFKKDYFTQAIPILNYLVEENYRPAESNFLLGEINYYRKKYQSAISYFKTSAVLYDKSKYMPKLLLHSAISFEKVSDPENAKSFYNTIIDIYPDSQESDIAVKNLAKISQ